MKTCPEDCDASCYRCLRSFKNKFEHQLLDRHVGAELLEYLVSGQLTAFDSERISVSTRLLFGDLGRQGNTEVRYELDATITSPSGERVDAPILATRNDGKLFVIALAGPLTGQHPADITSEPLTQKNSPFALIVVNELVVRGNLPTATRYVQRQLAA